MKRKGKFLLLILSIVIPSLLISFQHEKDIEESLSDKTISFNNLRLDYIERLNTTLDVIIHKGSEFPLHDMIELHARKMLTFKTEGYPANFYEKIFKEWFLDRFGINLASDRIYKVGKVYNLQVKNFEKQKLVYFENENEVQFYVDRKENASSIRLRPNIICPKPIHKNLNFVFNPQKPIQIIPVNFSK